jgi:transposase
MTIKIKKIVLIEDVYKEVKKENNPTIRARLLGIAAILEGKTRSYAAKLVGVSINNMRTWIQRFNDYGFKGLINKKQPGQESKWTSEIEKYLKDKVIKGPSFENDQRVTFRLIDLQKDLEKKFNRRYGISTIWYKLKELKLSWITVRQKNSKSDLLVQEEFKKKLQNY